MSPRLTRASNASIRRRPRAPGSLPGSRPTSSSPIRNQIWSPEPSRSAPNHSAPFGSRLAVRGRSVLGPPGQSPRSPAMMIAGLSALMAISGVGARPFGSLRQAPAPVGPGCSCFPCPPGPIRSERDQPPHLDGVRRAAAAAVHPGPAAEDAHPRALDPDPARRAASLVVSGSAAHHCDPSKAGTAGAHTITPAPAPRCADPLGAPPGSRSSPTPPPGRSTPAPADPPPRTPHRAPPAAPAGEPA